MKFVAVAALSITTAVHSAPSQPPIPARSWPPSPEQPRIAYSKSYSTPADFGVKTSAFKRFGQWLSGTGKSASALRKPFGLALDDNDNICLTDTGSNEVCFYDRRAKKWYAWGKVSKIQFLSPVSVAKHKNVLFVADSALGRVIAFGDDGKLRFQITNLLQRPCAVAVSSDRLYVADSQQHCVSIFSLDGKFQKRFGSRGAGNGEFNFPTHLALDTSGNLYVTDSMNSRVQIFSPEGVYQSEVGQLGDSPGQFGRPKGITVDREGRIYVVDAAFDNLQIFDRDHHLLLPIGEAGSEPGEFWLANGVAVTRNGEILVADCYNRRVQEFKYLGER